jgi:hypothetical protein
MCLAFLVSDCLSGHRYGVEDELRRKLKSGAGRNDSGGGSESELARRLIDRLSAGRPGGVATLDGLRAMVEEKLALTLYDGELALLLRAMDTDGDLRVTASDVSAWLKNRGTGGGGDTDEGAAGSPDAVIVDIQVWYRGSTKRTRLPAVWGSSAHTSACRCGAAPRARPPGSEPALLPARRCAPRGAVARSAGRPDRRSLSRARRRRCCTAAATRGWCRPPA